MKNFELLAPAGNFDKLKTAVYFGADAVYVGGRAFSLRAFSENFDDEEMAQAVEFVHANGKKIYVAVNILARNRDFERIGNYLKYLQEIGVDAVILSDPGIVALCAKECKGLDIHLSTQACTLNKYSAKFWAELGVKRIVLARELSLAEVKEISEYCGCEIEIFIHGAMCISYSGRCLLSNYLAGRDGNRGSCVQCCRWEYEIREKNKGGDYLPVMEDSRGTYIFNSKDLNLIDYLDEVRSSGAVSLKIEGRMKSEYYLATVVNAYRRAIDAYEKTGADYKLRRIFDQEVNKTAHRDFTTAYALGDNAETVNYSDSQSRGDRTFVAYVLGSGEDECGKYALVEMRNRFRVGDTLEVLSPSDCFNETIAVEKLREDEGGAFIDDAKLVQQKLRLYTDLPLSRGDILRK